MRVLSTVKMSQFSFSDARASHYCRLGDLLCYTCMLYLSIFCVSMHVNFVFSLFFVLFSFVASFSTLILLVVSFDL